MKRFLFAWILLLAAPLPSVYAQVYYAVTHTSGTQTIAGNDVTVTSAGTMPPATTCGVGPYLIGCAQHLNCPPGGSSYTFAFSRPVNIVRLRFISMVYTGTISININGTQYMLRAHNLSFPAITCTPATSNNVTTSNGNLYMGLNTGNGSTQVDIQTVVPIRTLQVIQQNQYQNNATFDFQFTQEYCAGQDIELTAPTIAGAAYTWTGPNGFTASSQNVSIPAAQVSASGNYQVTAIQGGNTVHSNSYTVLVNPKPAAPVVTSNSPLCSGETLQLGATGAGGYRWNGPLAFSSTLSNPSIPNVRAAHGGVYKVASVSNKGCVSDSGVVNVVVDVPPVVSFDYTISYGCGFDTVRFRNTTAGATNYIWDFGDGGSDVVAQPVHVYRTRGMFSYYVKLIAFSGCKKDSVVTIITLNNPLKADFSISPETICQGQSVTFTNKSTVSSGSPLTFFWDFMDGHTDVSEHPVHTFPEPGNYHVMLVAKDNIPCTDTAYQDIEVLPFSVDILGDTICPRDIQMEALITAPGYFTDFHYEWSPSSSFSNPRIINPVLYAKSPGVYTYVLKVTSDSPIGCTAYDTATIYVKPGMEFSYVSPDQVIPYGGSVQLRAEGALYYLWEPAKTLDNAHIGDPVASPLETTRYAVYGINEDGCWDTAYVTVSVNPPPDIFMPSAFSPNGDGKNDVLRVRNHKFHHLAEYRIFNRAGKEVFATTNAGEGWDGTFNGAQQPVGVYFYMVRINYADGSTRLHTGDVTLVR